MASGVGLLSAGVVVAWLGSIGTALAKVPQPFMAPANLPGTVSYGALPAGFDPTKVDDARLAELGFPPRPNAQHAPGAFRSWLQAVVGMRRIQPVLDSVAVHHGPLVRRSADLRDAAGSVTADSTNWSGMVVPAAAYAYGPQSLTSIYGGWSVPVAQPGFGACTATPDGGAVYSSSWVGIDGSGSGDVLQAGTESDAVCSAGQVAAYHGAWYEWYPFNEVRITNLPVGPGAAMYVYVWASSATRGHAYVANKTTRRAVAVAFDAPPGTQLIGNSAEWVVERPLVDGALTDLTNYVQEIFAGAEARDAQGHLFFPGGAMAGDPPALAVKMTDDARRVISTPSLLGQDAIWFMDQNGAMHTAG